MLDALWAGTSGAMLYLADTIILKIHDFVCILVLVIWGTINLWFKDF